MGKIRRFIGKILAGEPAKHQFSEVDQMKSQFIRAQNQNQKTLFEIQKMQLDAETEKLNALKMKIQRRNIQDQIADIEDQLIDEEEEDDDDESGDLLTDAMGLRPEDAALMKGLYGIAEKTGMIKTNVIQTTPNPQPQSVGSTSLSDVSDEEIKSYLDRVPKKILASVKKMPLEKQVEIVRSAAPPGTTDATIKRTIEMIKNV